MSRKRKSIIDIENQTMNSEEYALTSFVPGKTHLFYAQDRNGKMHVIAKWPVKDLQKKRSVKEFDVRNDDNWERISVASRKSDFIVNMDSHFRRGTGVDELKYIVTEYIEADPASALKTLYQDKQIGLDTVVGFFINLCSGVQALHEANFLHRDLKYTNILCDRDNLNPFIIDFNVGCGMDSITTKKGTKEFWAPEEIPYKKAPATFDIFPMGVMLWEILTDEFKDIHCFSGERNKIFNSERMTDEKAVEIFLNQRKEVTGSPVMTEIIYKAMQPRPKDRYQSAYEMRRDLVLANSPKLNDIFNEFSRIDMDIPDKIRQKKTDFPLKVVEDAVRAKRDFYSAFGHEKYTRNEIEQSYFDKIFSKVVEKRNIPKTIREFNRFYKNIGFNVNREIKDRNKAREHYSNERDAHMENMPAEEQEKATLVADKIYTVLDMLNSRTMFEDS